MLQVANVYFHLPIHIFFFFNFSFLLITLSLGLHSFSAWRILFQIPLSAVPSLRNWRILYQIPLSAVPSQNLSEKVFIILQWIFSRFLTCSHFLSALSEKHSFVYEPPLLLLRSWPSVLLLLYFLLWLL